MTMPRYFMWRELHKLRPCDFGGMPFEGSLLVAAYRAGGMQPKLYFTFFFLSCTCQFFWLCWQEARLAGRCLSFSVWSCGVPIPGGVRKMCGCGTSGHGLAGMGVLGWWLDLILEVFSVLLCERRIWIAGFGVFVHSVDWFECQDLSKNLSWLLHRAWKPLKAANII